MDRIEAIERSLRCFTLGLLGLIPLLGIPAALVARGEFRRVRRHYGRCWNPAQKYLLMGAVFAYFALGVTMVAAGLMLVLVLGALLF
jgi:hypothetical protein